VIRASFSLSSLHQCSGSHDKFPNITYIRQMGKGDFRHCSPYIKEQSVQFHRLKGIG